MKFYGQYLMNAESEEMVKVNTDEMFNIEIKPVIIERLGIKNAEINFSTEDVYRHPELEEYDDETGLCYEVGFYLELPVDVEEDSKEHYNIESIVKTGLSIVS